MKIFNALVGAVLVAVVCKPILAQAIMEKPATLPQFKIEVIDQSFTDLIDPEAKIKAVAEGFDWSEGPVWNKANQTLCFSDVPKNKIYQFKNGELSVFLQPSGYDGPSTSEKEPGSNGLIVDAGGHLTVCDHGNRRVYQLSKDGKTKTTIANEFDGKRFNSPNDLVIKSNGDIFFTDPPYGLKDKSKQEQGFFGVYCVEAADRSVNLVTKELVRPNGIGLSPDEKTLYVAQSHRPAPVYMKFAIKDDGSFGAGEVLYDSSEFAKDAEANPGMPDGMAIDVRGNLWATGPGGVLVISPTGKLLGRIYTGKPTANCAFVDDGGTLVMTADDHLLVVKTKTRGLGDWGEGNPNLLIPTDVVAGINAVLKEMRGFVKAKEYGKLIETVAPPEFIKEQKEKGKFEETVARFAERKVAEFERMLDEVAFTNANYSKQDETVTFLREERKAIFKKIDGKWKLQN
jgi:gluconolactonase